MKNTSPILRFRPGRNADYKRDQDTPKGNANEDRVNDLEPHVGQISIRADKHKWQTKI